jgi:DNA-binding response OmpR family regulator
MKPRLLLVEDDEKIQVLMSRVLADQDYLVVTASDGETALDLLITCTFDVVLTDIFLAGQVNGLEVIHIARHLVVPPEVIVVSGESSAEVKAKAFQHGACCYLLKPCDMNDVVVAVQDALRLRQGGQPSL